MNVKAISNILSLVSEFFGYATSHLCSLGNNSDDDGNIEPAGKTHSHLSATGNSPRRGETKVLEATAVLLIA